MNGFILHPSSFRLHPSDILDLLTQLANKSLIVVEQPASGETRYRLLETVRQYAREKLLDATGGDPSAWRERHRRYFQQHAEQTEPKLHGPQLVTWLNRFELEHDNFRAALGWALDLKHGDPLAALRLACALGYFWERRSYVSEGVGWLEAALVRAASAAPADAAAARPYQLARASALAARALLDFGTMNNVPAVLAAAQESVQVARPLGDERVLGVSLAVLALAMAYWGDTTLARAAGEEALALPGLRNAPEVVLIAYGALAVLHSTVDHQAQQAYEFVTQALPLARQLGDPWVIAQITLGLGRIGSQSGDLDESRARIEEAIELFGQVGDLSQVNHARSDLARVLRQHGQLNQAVALYHDTLRDWQHMGHRGAVAQQLESLAFIAIELGQGARAARLLGATESLRALSGAVRLTQQQAEYDQALNSLRAQLPAPELEAAWAQGRAMPVDQAIAYALDETP